MLKVIETNRFDCGTTEYTGTDGKLYCVDRRAGSKTYGKIFHGFPMQDGANMVSEDLEKELRRIIYWSPYEKTM